MLKYAWTEGSASILSLHLLKTTNALLQPAAGLGVRPELIGKITEPCFMINCLEKPSVEAFHQYISQILNGLKSNQTNPYLETS